MPMPLTAFSRCFLHSSIAAAAIFHFLRHIFCHAIAGLPILRCQSTLSFTRHAAIAEEREREARAARRGASVDMPDSAPLRRDRAAPRRDITR